MICGKCGHGNLDGSLYCSRCAAQLRLHGQGPEAAETGTAGGCAVPLIIFGVMALIGCLLIFVFGPGEIKGEVRARGAPFGDYALKPSVCTSGEHQSFFGVWLAAQDRSSGGRVAKRGGIKLMKTPLEEWKVFAETPGACQGEACLLKEIPRTECARFEVDVHNTSTIVNDIRVREGRVNLDCRSPAGGTFSANLVFDGCH